MTNLLVLPSVFFNDTATTEIYTLSLHDALPIFFTCCGCWSISFKPHGHHFDARHARSEEHTSELQSPCNLVCRLLLEKQFNDLLAHLAISLTSRRGVASRAELAALKKDAARKVFSLIAFFFNDTATTEIYPLSLHDALPI